MRKAVAVAFVLIASAAVILWYGNHLNSWVLGGLIGGLASLLLSIPISLILYTSFSRHTEVQRQQTEGYVRHISLEQGVVVSGYLPEGIEEEYYDEDGEFLEDEMIYEDEDAVSDEYSPPERTRRDSGWLDVEFGPHISSSHQHSSGSSARQLPVPYRPQQPKMSSSDFESLPNDRRRGGRRLSSSNSQERSQFRAQALHTARLEALRQAKEGDDGFPTLPPSRTMGRSGRRIVDSLPPSKRDEEFFSDNSPSTRRPSRYPHA